MRRMTIEPRRFARELRKNATTAEDGLWQALRGHRLAGLKFRRQVPMLGYTVDFLCFDRKLVVELDGKQHEWLAEYDAKRTEKIERQGFTVLRFSNADVLDHLNRVLRRIVKAATAPSSETFTLTPGLSPGCLRSKPGEGGVMS